MSAASPSIGGKLGALVAAGINQRAIAERFGLTPARVCQLRRGLGFPPRQQDGWSDAEAAVLGDLWLAGTSAGEIARRLGAPRTRGSVLGKANRMGLVPRPTSIKKGGLL